MKKTYKLIVLSVLLTLILTGVLYATYEQPGEVETVTAGQVYMNQLNQFPVPMPDVVMGPMTGFPLF